MYSAFLETLCKYVKFSPNYCPVLIWLIESVFILLFQPRFQHIYVWNVWCNFLTSAKWKLIEFWVMSNGIRRLIHRYYCEQLLMVWIKILSKNSPYAPCTQTWGHPLLNMKMVACLPEKSSSNNTATIHLIIVIILLLFGAQRPFYLEL